MAEPVWGGLAKAGEDPEKIEEAIARMINEHNDDPDAHVGASQSLGAHRENGVVDHPARSIVPDKFSAKQKEFTTLFESTSTWIKQGSVVSGLMNLRVGVYGNAGVDSYAYNEDIYFSCDESFGPKDGYVQLNGEYSNFYSIADIYFGIGVSDGVPTGDYVLAFKISGSTLYCGYSTGGAVTWSSKGTLSQNVKHVFRIEVNKEFKEAYFLLDGVVVHTVDLSSLADWNYTTFGIYVDKTGGTTNVQYKGLQVNYLAYWNALFGV